MNTLVPKYTMAEIMDYEDDILRSNIKQRLAKIIHISLASKNPNYNFKLSFLIHYATNTKEPIPVFGESITHSESWLGRQKKILQVLRDDPLIYNETDFEGLFNICIISITHPRITFS